jgi:DNA-binding NtrC family response regulator
MIILTKVLLMIKFLKKVFGKSEDVKKEIIKSPLREITEEEFEKIKFKARIAFVDDEEISHIKRLQTDGYNITPYGDIDNIDDFVRKKYNVVVLDIQGIGQKIASKSEGWGILKYLKKNHPHIIVIMFTGAEWSITKYKDEASEADDFISKDVDFLDFKEKLDDGIRKAFSIKYHYEIERKRLLNEISNTQTINEIKLILDEYGANKEVAMEKVKEKSSNSNVIQIIDNLVSIGKSISELL